MNKQSHPPLDSLHTLSADLASIVERVGDWIYAVPGRGGHTIASAVLWRDDILVTTAHPFRRAPNEISMIDAAGQLQSAALIGVDSSTDLAVFRLAKAPDAAAELGDATSLRAGHLVIAVGRSASGDVTASYGMVNRASGSWQTWQGGQLDRQIRLDGGLYGGQSGAAIVDTHGKVVGIGSSALARGYGVVIPASNISRVVDSLLTRGHVARPYLGIGAQPVALPLAADQGDTREQTKEHTNEQTALLVTALAERGPAQTAGVLIGDILVAVGGHKLGSLSAMRMALASHVGETVTFDLIRGGVGQQIAITVAPWPTSSRRC